MTTRELLENYRMLVIEMETLELQSDFLNRFIGAPSGIKSAKLTGMPKGTNEPVAAMIQRNDVDDVLDRIEEMGRELCCLLDRFERIMESIRDRRLKIIIRDYYALGWSEEKVGEHVGLTRQHVNRLRSAYLKELDKK